MKPAKVWEKRICFDKNGFLIYVCYRILSFTKEKWVQVQLGHTIWFYSIMYNAMVSFLYLFPKADIENSHWTQMKIVQFLLEHNK